MVEQTGRYIACAFSVRNTKEPNDGTLGSFGVMTKTGRSSIIVKYFWSQGAGLSFKRGLHSLHLLTKQS